MASIAVRMMADVSGLTQAFGQAERMADAFKAKIVQTGNLASRAFTAASTSVRAFASGASTVLTSLGRLSSVASSSAAILSKFTGGNEELKKRFESLTITLAILAPALSALGPAIAFLSGPIGLIVAAIGAAILVFRNWEAVSRAVVNTAARVWATLGEFFMKLWTGIGEGARGLGQILLGALTLDTARIQAGFAQMMAGFEQVKDTMVAAASGIASGIGSVVTRLSEMVSGIGAAQVNAGELAAVAQQILDESTEANEALKARIRLHEEEARVAEEAAIAAHDHAVAVAESQSIINERERESLILREESNRMAQVELALMDQKAQMQLANAEREKAFHAQSLQFMLEQGVALLAAFGQFKAAAIAQAIISTAQGVSRALGEWPWPFSLVVGAIVAAAGAAQIAAIASASMAAGGIVTQPIRPLIGEAGPEAVIPLTGSRGRAALAGLGMGVIQIEVPVHLDGRLIAKSMVEHIPGAARTRGGIRRV